MNEQQPSFWDTHAGADLSQGDLLNGCLVPIFPSNLSLQNDDYSVEIGQANLIIMTQSCDLAAQKVHFVALCPVFTLHEMEEADSKFKTKGSWEQVRRGRREGLHMIPSPENPEDNLSALVVDFREIYSLPLTYLTEYATSLGGRPRLRSPFLEHFSQSFARFFMRVGLPTSIKPFK